jgi:ubiquinone/menaquinone biosynthesis C-methylase UbiE
MKNVKKFYTKYGIKEWRRLESDPLNRLEFLTTLKYLKKYLPGKGRILDAGGGPGRYTVELAKLGYKVILLDYTPKLLEIAERKIKRAGVEKNVDAIIEGDIRDLSIFRDNSFDAVICTGGPISHLLRKKDRLKAVKELRRVAKRGAPVFISVMGKLAVLTLSIWMFPEAITSAVFKRYRDTGDYAGAGSGLGAFTAFHMFMLSDFEKLVKLAGLKIIKEVGLEGIASGLEKYFNIMARDPKKWKAWLETHFKMCEISSVVDASQHMLMIAKK